MIEELYYIFKIAVLVVGWGILSIILGFALYMIVDEIKLRRHIKKLHEEYMVGELY